jgi:hypothetical protein
MRNPKILVVDAPDCANHVARVIPGLNRIPAIDGRGELALVVADPDMGEIARLVPTRCIATPQAAAYAEHWATLTGRSVADIYIPEALR